MMECVFCDIIHLDAPADVVQEYKNTLIITPLNPVVDGHKIAIPMMHVDDATVNPLVTGAVMEDAAKYVNDFTVGPCNFITSVGEEATQSVFHLHIHIVPRTRGDNLKLPWSKH